MSFSVNAIIKNTSQMNWIPMVGRIVCAAMSIEMAYRSYQKWNQYFALAKGKEPDVIRIKGETAGTNFNMLANLGTENLTKAFFFATCSLNSIPGSASIGLVYLLKNSIIDYDPKNSNQDGEPQRNPCYIAEKIHNLLGCKIIRNLFFPRERQIDPILINNYLACVALFALFVFSYNLSNNTRTPYWAHRVILSLR